MSESPTPPAESKETFSHIALLIGPAAQMPTLTGALLYDGLAILGASGSAPGPEHPEGITESLLSELIEDVYERSGKTITDLHVLRFPGEHHISVPALFDRLRQKHLPLHMARVDVETEDGCRAYFEEACSLSPQPRPENPEEHAHSLIPDVGMFDTDPGDWADYVEPEPEAPTPPAGKKAAADRIAKRVQETLDPPSEKDTLDYWYRKYEQELHRNEYVNQALAAERNLRLEAQERADALEDRADRQLNIITRLVTYLTQQ